MEKHNNFFEVNWKNFKGFENTGWLKIKPLTILLGSNNVGKTSFLAPFLLLNQTLNSRDRLSPLILKGNVYDGGNYQEIVKDYDFTKEIFLGFKYHSHESKGKIEKVGSYPPGGFEAIIKVDTKDGDVKLKKMTIFDIFNREYISLSLNSTDTYDYVGVGSESLSSLELKTIINSKPINFLFSPNSILAELDTISEEHKDGKIKRKISQFSNGFSQFLSVISYNNAKVRNYLGDLSFIGPIREYPHRIYEITNETYNTVGSKGENFPNLLKKLGVQNKVLNQWIQKFGFGDKIELKHHYSNTYSIRFCKDDCDYYTSIANSGFGASQVLPLIIQSLVSPKRSVTIAEQPEIHLNPKIQCVLAELFVSMANKGQTVIIETHSEHLLLRLRRLIAEEKINSENVAIYFVEKDGTDSKIKEIKLQENGHINPIDWPKDFLGESLKESIALASIQSKRRKK